MDGWVFITLLLEMMRRHDSGSPREVARDTGVVVIHGVRTM